MSPAAPLRPSLKIFLNNIPGTAEGFEGRQTHCQKLALRATLEHFLGHRGVDHDGVA